ncbi:hypothetical protein Sste5344_001473 [Sporothrix stenoceras]
MPSKIFGKVPERDPRFFNPPPNNIPVLIVGAGPTGLSLAYLLARLGIRSAVIDKHAVRLGQPKAHAINPRSLEIFRQAGLDIPALRALGASVDDGFWVSYVSGLPGVELCKLPYERQDEDVKALTPEPLLNIAQPVLEVFLEDAVMATELVTIHRCYQWEGVLLGADERPISAVRNRDEEGKVLKIRSEFVVGADGVASAVRAALKNVTFDSPPGVDRPQKTNFYQSIHCRGNVSSLLQPDDTRATLYFCAHPEHAAGIIVYDIALSFVHVTQVNIDGNDDTKRLTADKCTDIVKSCMPTLDFEPLSVTLWQTWPRVASAYSDSSHNHRVFVAGDAAHSFPPQGGLGVNTGFADVHNLAWKLGMALRGGEKHQQDFLKSYTDERKPVATANAVQSAENERVGIEVNPALSRIASDGEAASDLATHVKKQDVQSELQHLAALSKPHFDSLVLQLGYVYGTGQDGTVLLDDVCGQYLLPYS